MVQKGITCSLFFLYKKTDTGRAIKLPKKILTIPKSGSNTKPITNNSLTSPPPKLSFFSKKSPNFIKAYITRKRKTAPPIIFKLPTNPS